MSSKLIVHIDDYGVTENYSQDILVAVKSGIVDSISILPNAFYTNKALELITPYRDKIDLSVHLNIIEGYPLSKDSSMLVSSNGEFNIGFLQLILFPILNSKIITLKFRTQIKEEFKAQIKKILDQSPENKKLSLDSHRHIHLIPFVFHIVVELAEELNLDKIRIINEPFYFCFSPFRNIKAYFNGNIIKHFLLNILSILAAKTLSRNGKQCFHSKDEKFLGILFSDLMSSENITKGLRKTAGQKTRVLLHAGVKLLGEGYLGTNQTFLNYYESINRAEERNEILSDNFKILYKRSNDESGSK